MHEVRQQAASWAPERTGWRSWGRAQVRSRPSVYVRWFPEYRKRVCFQENWPWRVESQTPSSGSNLYTVELHEGQSEERGQQWEDSSFWWVVLEDVVTPYSGLLEERCIRNSQSSWWEYPKTQPLVFNLFNCWSNLMTFSTTHYISNSQKHISSPDFTSYSKSNCLLEIFILIYLKVFNKSQKKSSHLCPPPSIQLPLPACYP